MKEPLIVCSPGHGGADPGASSEGYVEKRFNWQIAHSIKRHLLPYKCTFVIVQPSDHFYSTGRDELVVPPMVAKYLKADYYLSTHLNAGGGMGFESYVRNSERGTESDHKRGVIHDEIMAGLQRYGIEDRGKKYADYLELVLSDDDICDSCLLEYLFIDNDQHLNLLLNDSFIEAVGNWTAYGLAQALGIELRSVDIG